MEIKKVTARKAFEVKDDRIDLDVKINKGDVGELLGFNKSKRVYTILINGKTLYIEKRKVLRYLFRIE